MPGKWLEADDVGLGRLDKREIGDCTRNGPGITLNEEGCVTLVDDVGLGLLDKREIGGFLRI